MPFIIKSVSNGMVLDVRNSEKRNGAEVILWPYNGGNNQLWEYKNNMIYSKLGKYVLSQLSVMNVLCKGLLRATLLLTSLLLASYAYIVLNIQINLSFVGSYAYDLNIL
jgi:hypothetical protein